MQRLFATFPDGQPGAALLFLRLALAGILVSRAPVYWQGVSPLWVHLSCDALAMLLALGLFTPFVAMSGAALGILGLLLCNNCDPVAEGFVLVVMAALGMLGAGAYSLDARMYGRREVVVSSRHDS